MGAGCELGDDSEGAFGHPTFHILQEIRRCTTDSWTDATVEHTGDGKGYRVYFTTAMDLAQRLTKAVDSNRLHRQLKALVQSKLLVLDEVGYLTLDPLQASLLFQVICQRYQRSQPIALTSNKAFSDWGQVFADDAVLASATLDRLLHRSTILNIRGESYRLKENAKRVNRP